MKLASHPNFFPGSGVCEVCEEEWGGVMLGLGEENENQKGNHRDGCLYMGIHKENKC